MHRNTKKFLMMIVCTLFSVPALSNESHGVLMVVKGEVKIEVSKSGKTEKGKVGFKVFPGDAVVTGKDSRAKLVMIDKNVINISPDSKFVLEKYVYNPDEDKKDVSLNVIYGKIRNTVNQKYDGEKNKFHVKTASAVAGVRGTDFVVQFNQTTKVSKVFTFHGKVEVGKGLDTLGKIVNPVSVQPGQFTVASMKTPPSLPVQANPMEMQAMNMNTDAEKAPDPEHEDNGNHYGQDKEKKDKRMPANEGSGEGSGPEMGSPMGPEGSRDPNAFTPSMMDMMGDDAIKDISADVNMPRPDMNFLPPPMPEQCPGGYCLPPNLNPEYFQGTTRLIINITQ